MSSELHHHAEGPLHVGDLQHVLQGERLEVEGVGDVEVGGDGLGVGVHHYRAVAQLPEGQHRPDAAVVELDALPDAVGPAAQDQDGFLPGGRSLVLFVVTGVEIGRGGGELAGAGVHHLVGRADA